MGCRPVCTSAPPETSLFIGQGRECTLSQLFNCLYSRSIGAIILHNHSQLSSLSFFLFFNFLFFFFFFFFQSHPYPIKKAPVPIKWTLLNPCPAEYIKMLRPFKIFSQPDYLIQIIDINSHTELQTVQIQISWLLRSQLIWSYTVCKGRVYPGSAGQGLIKQLPVINIHKR